jgi:hypothetical protein
MESLPVFRSGVEYMKRGFSCQETFAGLAGLQFAEGDGSDSFEILLVIRQKLENPMVDHGGHNIQVMDLLA